MLSIGHPCLHLGSVGLQIWYYVVSMIWDGHEDRDVEARPSTRRALNWSISMSSRRNSLRQSISAIYPRPSDMQIFLLLARIFISSCRHVKGSLPTREQRKKTVVGFVPSLVPGRNSKSVSTSSVLATLKQEIGCSVGYVTSFGLCVCFCRQLLDGDYEVWTQSASVIIGKLSSSSGYVIASELHLMAARKHTVGFAASSRAKHSRFRLMPMLCMYWNSTKAIYYGSTSVYAITITFWRTLPFLTLLRSQS